MASKNLAFFGATGDTAGFCLAAALKREYDCIALARTPKKLSASMTAKGVSQELQAARLTIIKGDVRDLSTVKQALVLKGKVVDIIISGVGCTSFKFSWNPIFPFALSDPTICTDATTTIFAALASLATPKTSPTRSNKPLLITISTTGIPAPGKPRDIPLPYILFYYWFLHSPHADKVTMEIRIQDEVAKNEGERVIGGSVIIRPSFLVGESRGWENLRVGTDEEPPRGYFCERRDVGEFVFERMIRRDVEKGWVDAGVHLTH